MTEDCIKKIEIERIFNEYDCELISAKDAAVLRLINKINSFLNSAYINLLNKKHHKIKFNKKEIKSLSHLYVKTIDANSCIVPSVLVLYDLSVTNLKSIEFYLNNILSKKTSLFQVIFNDEIIIIQDHDSSLIVDLAEATIIENTFNDNKLDILLYLLLTMTILLKNDHRQKCKVIQLADYLNNDVKK